VASIRLAILTISDGVAAGVREDGSGDAIAAWSEARGHVIVSRRTVPDEAERIASAIAHVVDRGAAELVITTGGTGFTSRDVTPEATRSVLEREAPGIAEAIRFRGSASTPFAWLSRGVAGIRAGALIVNLPGSEGGVRDGLEVLDAVGAHAIQLLRGQDTTSHGTGDG
jgi:molybdopterin adenylyltransferase